MCEFADSSPPSYTHPKIMVFLRAMWVLVEGDLSTGEVTDANILPQPYLA